MEEPSAHHLIIHPAFLFDKHYFDLIGALFYTTNQALKYRLFAAVVFDDRYITGNYNFQDPADFQMYLDELRSSINGHVNKDVNVTQESGILTLSTCIATSPNERWMVNATREQ